MSFIYKPGSDPDPGQPALKALLKHVKGVVIDSEGKITTIEVGEELKKRKRDLYHEALHYDAKTLNYLNSRIGSELNSLTDLLEKGGYVKVDVKGKPRLCRFWYKKKK